MIAPTASHTDGLSLHETSPEGIEPQTSQYYTKSGALPKIEKGVFSTARTSGRPLFDPLAWFGWVCTAHTASLVQFFHRIQAPNIRAKRGWRCMLSCRPFCMLALAAHAKAPFNRSPGIKRALLAVVVKLHGCDLIEVATQFRDGTVKL